jgi:hypothetical protein
MFEQLVVTDPCRFSRQKSQLTLLAFLKFIPTWHYAEYYLTLTSILLSRSSVNSGVVKWPYIESVKVKIIRSFSSVFHGCQVTVAAMSGVVFNIRI